MQGHLLLFSPWQQMMIAVNKSSKMGSHFNFWYCHKCTASIQSYMLALEISFAIDLQVNPIKVFDNSHRSRRTSEMHGIRALLFYDLIKTNSQAIAIHYAGMHASTLWLPHHLRPLRRFPPLRPLSLRRSGFSPPRDPPPSRAPLRSS